MIDSLIGVDPHLVLQLVELEEKARLKEAANNNYLDYVDYVHEGQFKRTKHSVVVCNAIQDALTEAERIQAKVENGIPLTGDEGVVVLLISLPPQHGKSISGIETLPSYFNGRHPDKNSLLISYNQNSARKFGRRNRYKVDKFAKEIFNEQLDDTNSSVEEFGLKGRTGIIKSVGINGSITGYMGNLVMIDDPYKNGKEANSPIVRGSIQSTLEDSVLTRLHPGTLLIVVHTRWHEDDLISYLKSFYGDRARVLSIPAECESEADDPIGRKVGEFLWVKHHGVQYYLDRKKNTRVWSALYQQRPAAMEGALFIKSKFNYYRKKELPLTPDGDIDYRQFSYMAVIGDFTFEKDLTSDFVAVHVWGMLGDKPYCLKRYKKRMDFKDSKDKILQVMQDMPNAQWKLMEKKANGHAIIQYLVDHGVRGIVPLSPTESKEHRAGEVCHIINEGRVYLPAEDPTIHEMVSEVGNFPFDKHDDETDVMVHYLMWVEKEMRKGKRFIGRVT